MLFEKIQLESDEKIIKTVHKHWYSILSRTIGTGIISLLPLLGWIVIGNLIATIPNFNGASIEFTLSQYTSYFIFFYSMWLLVNWMFLAHMWTTHYLDIWVITDRRVVVIDQVSLFRRHIGSFRLEKLQDVNIEINGIIATFLNYGVLEAETASGSHDDEFRSKHIPQPREVKALILKLADERMNMQNNNT